MDNNYEWINYLIGSTINTKCCTDTENPNVYSFKTTTWINYFDQDEVTTVFVDQLASPVCTFKNYFTNISNVINRQNIVFDEITAFTDKEDWIRWKNLFQPFQWINFHDNPEWNDTSEIKINLCTGGGGRECESESSIPAITDKKLVSPSNSPQNDDSNNDNYSPSFTTEQSQHYTTTPTNSRPFSSRSLNLQDQKTFLTPKKREWVCPKFEAVVALLNTRHNTTMTIPQLKVDDDDIVSSLKTPEKKPPSPRSSFVLTLAEDDTDVSQELSNDLVSQASSSNDISQAECHNDIDDDPHSCSHDMTLASLPEIDEPKDDDDDYEDILNFPALTPDPSSPLKHRLSPKSPGSGEYKKRQRPYSSQGPLFSEFGDSSLLQVPSNYNTSRRTSEPELPKLVPPKIVKTPPDETKYWAVRKNEPWISFEKPERSKSPFKKLKKIPEHRSRSAMEKPTVFDITTPIPSTKGRNSPLPPLAHDISPKKTFSPFRFSRLSVKVTPESLLRGKNHEGILSKINPKKPKNRKRHGGKSFFKRKNWVPIIRSILGGSFRKKSDKVKSPGMQNTDEKSLSIMQNNLSLPFSSSDYVNVVDYRNHNVLPDRGSAGPRHRPMGADPRRRSPWIRFLRYWDIRRHFERRSRRKQRCDHKIKKTHF